MLIPARISKCKKPRPSQTPSTYLSACTPLTTFKTSTQVCVVASSSTPVLSRCHTKTSSAQGSRRSTGDTSARKQKTKGHTWDVNSMISTCWTYTPKLTPTRLLRSTASNSRSASRVTNLSCPRRVLVPSR